MNDYYLGYVEWIQQEGLYGRIRPLATLKKRSADDAWVVDREYKRGELGETNRVFWPKIPRDQEHLAGQYVRFKAEVNQRARDSEREWHDFVVAGEWQHGNVRRVSTLGVPTVAEDRVLGPERAVSPNPDLRAGAIVYRRRLKDTTIDGPWRLAEVGDPTRLCLQPKQDGYVLVHVLARLGSETYHVWDDDGDEIQVVLLVEPAKAEGRVIDLLSPSGLADWLVRVLKRDRVLLATFDSASPGWRGRVDELVDTVTDSVQRAVEQGRYARLGTALDALAADEAQLANIAELPRFKAMLDAAIGREVAAARQRIEATAVGETRGFVDRQKQDREEAKARAEREKQSLLGEVARIRAEVADAERLRAESRAKVERDESSVRAAADYLMESRERIVRDFSAFQGLIEAARSGGGVSANGLVPTADKLPEVAPPARPAAAHEGPPVDEPEAFLCDRLSPALAAWGAEATRRQAKALHAALLCCRWVATPCPSWGVAYAEAVGADARPLVVTVEPTWLTFADAWGGEVGAFWREAVVVRDALHLLIFADADRALVQCWARPWLDVASGLRRTLPSGLPWPENLRVVVCPAADEAALPVPDWVVAHWAGVKAAPPGATGPDRPLVSGHVPFAAWSGWVTTPSADPRPLARLGAAARAAALERSALALTFQQLKPDGDPEEAGTIAHEVREVDARIVFSRGATK